MGVATKLVFGVPIRVSRRWNRVKITRPELAQLRNIRKLTRPDQNDETQKNLATSCGANALSNLHRL